MSMSDIKKLLNKKKLTGDEAGRLMIMDLVEVYSNALKKDYGDGTGKGVLTQEEMDTIVNGLNTSEDIKRYNEYRAIHDFFTHATLMSNIMVQAVEIASSKLHLILTGLFEAEREYRAVSEQPFIMTQKQYDDFKKENLEEKTDPWCCIAIIQPNTLTASNTGNIDERGYYVPPLLSWNTFLAEHILEDYGELIKGYLENIKDTITMHLARNKAVELVGAFVKVEHVDVFTSDIDSENLANLNTMMAQIPNLIYRCGITDGERPPQELQIELKKLLQPIDLEALKPSPEATKKATNALHYNTMQGRREEFVNMLARKISHE